MNTEQERAEFEAWHAEHYAGGDWSFDRDPMAPDEYADLFLVDGWEAWQARAALQSQDDWISPTSLTGLEKDELIRQLQWALGYWMPPIAGEDTPDGERASKEAYLLLGMRTPVGRENENTPSYWEKREALQSQDREDAERMDWLESVGSVDIVRTLDNKTEVYAPHNDLIYAAAGSLRAAIDHARRVEGGRGMIQITDINGHTHHLHADAIARITEAGVSGKWHGILAHVKTFDGKTIDARESALDIALMVDAEKETK